MYFIALNPTNSNNHRYFFLLFPSFHFYTLNTLQNGDSYTFFIESFLLFYICILYFEPVFCFFFWLSFTYFIRFFCSFLLFLLFIALITILLYSYNIFIIFLLFTLNISTIRLIHKPYKILKPKNCILNLSFSMFIHKIEFNSPKFANFSALKC